MDPPLRGKETKYHFEIHKEESGFWAQCVEFPGCVTQGKTEDELRENIEEALSLFLEEESRGLIQETIL